MDGAVSRYSGHRAQQPALLLVVFYQVLEYLRFITVVFNRIYEHSLYLSHKLLLPVFFKKVVGISCNLSTGLEQSIYFWKDGDNFYVKKYLQSVFMYFLVNR